MSKWEMVRLGDVCSNKILTLSSKDDFLIDYIDISSVDNQKKKIVSYQTIESKDAPSRAKQILNRNDIIVSTVRPNLNAVAVNDIESENKVVASTGYCVIRCNEMAEIRYVFNYCKSKTFVDSLVKKAKGASYPAVSNSDVKDSLIPLPSLDVQKHTADILDKAQELIDGHIKQLEELDNLIKATFYDMFGDPVANNKGWEIIELGEVAKLIGGYAFKSSDYADKGIRLIQIANVQKDILSWDITNYLPEKYLGKYENYNLASGDIVLAMTRPIIKSLDAVKIAVVQHTDVPCLLNQRVGKFDINKELLSPSFLLEFCRTQYFKNAVELFSSNSLQPNVSSKQIESILCYLPPLDLQTKFAEIVTNIEQQKTIVKKSIKESQNLFNSLMSKYFD